MIPFQMKNNITGIILTGGKSSRMGTDKAELPYNGKKLVEYSIETLRPLCNDIFISSSAPEHRSYALPTIEDEYPNMGPIMGIYSCLKKSKTDLNLVISCDMPHINSEVLSLLLDNSCSMAKVFTWGAGKVEPLAGLYSKAIIPFIEKQIAEHNYKLMQLLDSSNAAKLELEGHDGSYIFKNMNRPADLADELMKAQ